MLNTKETLKKLHKRFPMMNLDELFEILDCYIEDTIATNIGSWPKVWYSDNSLKTNGIEFNKNTISCPTSNKINRKYDGNTITTAEPSSIQFTTSH